MAKVSPVYVKYIIHAEFYADGVVEKPDVIGAIFGQTEGLLGESLDLRELQRSGKIGRIDVKLRAENRKTKGIITIPTSLNRFETALIASALETINRIGPAAASVKVIKIENVRKAKIQYILERAKDLLKKLVDEELPDTKELLTYLEYAYKMRSLIYYGPERLPAGPDVDKSEELIIVEGRADVLNLLKYGITNVIALNGLNVPKTIVDLSKKKIVTAFFDGDRAGDLIIKELYMNGVEIDFVARPDPGKEVEEISRKEIMKALKNKVPFDQVKSYYERLEGSIRDVESMRKTVSDPVLYKLKQMFDSVFKTEQALIVDKDLRIINKVPSGKVGNLLQNIHGSHNIFAIVMDGVITRELIELADSKGITYLIGLDSVSKEGQRVKVFTIKDLDKVTA